MTNAPTPLIVVGVPVWRGAEFVAETLRSVLAQSGVELRVIISVDGPDDESVAACRPFLDDSRVKLVVQPARLGWATNAAAIQAAALADGADYVCLQPQDDTLEEIYLSELLAAAEALPKAAVVYSDIRAFGLLDRVIRQPSVIGSKLGRQASLLIDHFNAVAYRGLTRAGAVRAAGRLSGNAFDDFAADTVWMAQVALVGHLIRVPEPLYRKRYHAGNTHAAWSHWPAERKIAAWRQHCVDMIAIGLRIAKDAAARNLLIDAARIRLLGAEGAAGPYRRELSALTAEDRAQLLHDFDAALPPQG